MASLQQIIDFDGVWNDMNEPSSYCDGECGYPSSKFVGNLPFVLGVDTHNAITIDLVAANYQGLLELDLNNLY